MAELIINFSLSVRFESAAAISGPEALAEKPLFTWPMCSLLAGEGMCCSDPNPVGDVVLLVPDDGEQFID